VTDRSARGSRSGAPSSGAAGSFGDVAAEMANETEVEEPVAPREQQVHEQARDAARPDELTDISGVDNMVEEGAPLEPSDLEDEEDAGDRLAAAQQALTERTADLQRIQAEYLNYKRRVDRDRELVRENATYAALAPIVDVLDTIDRAREHGALEDGFQAVADQLERVVAGAGLIKYGEVGDPFDPRLHEALSHIGEDPDVEVTTCKVIAKAGYRIGERVVRAAQVLVVDPVST
jgi:molecular chaperone GrpE